MISNQLITQLTMWCIGMNNNSINNVVFLHEKNMHLTKLHQSMQILSKINNMIGK